MKGSAGQIHIVAFDVPYPADYGGVIDIFYKIKALHRAGVQVHLHCYTYGRAESKILKKYCATVRYYRRKVFRNPIYNKKPYIVASRNSSALIEDLMTDDHPILFEGLHSTYYLDDPRLKDRFKIVRTHNVEHDYYRQLEKVENNVFKKYFFKIEADRLKRYQKTLKHANLIAAISQNDTSYFSRKFNDVIYLPPFHRNDELETQTGRGEFILYHGNLSVGENNVAALFLVNKVFSKLDIPCVIAGNGATDDLKNAILQNGHIDLVDGVTAEEIEELIRDAHINVLPTRQATGIKLKLVNALFMGRYCVANSKMIDNTGLEDCCVQADTAAQFIEAVNDLWQREFGASELAERKDLLVEGFCNMEGIDSLISRIPQLQSITLEQA